MTSTTATSPFGSGGGAAFVGDEILVLQCALQARELGLEPVVVVSANRTVLAHAADEGLPTLDGRSVDDLTGALKQYDFKFLFSIAYQHLLDAGLLEQAQWAVNFHDGLLPEYGGLNVTTWSLLNGEEEHGITWHHMTELADRGAVLHEHRFPVAPDDTAFSLSARCYEAGLATFADVATELLEGHCESHPQRESQRRMYRRTQRPVVFLDPWLPAEDIARAVRALDVGRWKRNPVGSVRWLLGEECVLVGSASVRQDGSATPGRVESDGPGIVVGTIDGSLVIGDLTDSWGRPIDVREHAGISAAVEHGALLDDRSGRASVLAALSAADRRLAGAEAWWSDRLEGVAPHVPEVLVDGETGEWIELEIPHGEGASGVEVCAAVAAWLHGVHAGGTITCAVSDSSARLLVAEVPFCELPTLVVEVEQSASTSDLTLQTAQCVEAALEHGPYLRDLVARTPALCGAPMEQAVAVHLGGGGDVPVHGRFLDLVVEDDSSRVVLRHCLDEQLGERITGQLSGILRAMSASDPTPVTQLELRSPNDVALLDRWNDTAVDHDRTLTVDELFRRQVGATPTACAVSAAGRTLTYSELAAEVATMEGLLGSNGVKGGDTVGIALERGIDMVVSVLAILGMGANYLPLDPDYPADRLQFMVTDSGAERIIGRPTMTALFADTGSTLIDPADRVRHTARKQLIEHDAASLAYVIYTSGSTGRPKGVELEHRQVVNFFVGMDRVVDTDEPGTWLAVTSLSFDISVLELLWTLTRGFHVVVKRDSGLVPATHPSSRTSGRRRVHPVQMSLFYFAAGEEQAASGYRLLLESARWADVSGFEAVWMPERHFHHFGAPYPNPSVVAAAVAAVTDHVSIRAGSVVLPLHSPIRVAEEWAVVDNLSRGRVGISFAAGWQPNDFVLNPQAYATSREDLPTLVDTVRRLWRGEVVPVPGPDGSLVGVTTLPRPVQAELPVWLTSAGTPSTFERAGRLGYNVLTHLIGQTVDELEANVRTYRVARERAGIEGPGSVTLMLHTYLHDDGDRARETARSPLKGYLGTAVGLLKDLASAFPTFTRMGTGADDAFRSLSDEEVSQLLDHAADRYLLTAGLFGTVDDAVRMIDQVTLAGVDEIACLIDFGIDDDLVLEGLERLAALHARVRSGSADVVPDNTTVDESVAGLVAAYGVTHLQCTPSLAAMLAADPADREALASISHMLVGGEALPAALAQDLRNLVPGRFTNMYGPTETTIWSLTHEISEVAGSTVPIGRPIANTAMLVMDPMGRPVPVGVPGELHLGGEGVARGYHNRPELSEERFVVRPGIGRAYSTGDVVRVAPDGTVEFLGRSDDQVKIRGHRVELSEIESVIDELPAVAQSVVVARGDGEPTLVAYVVPHGGIVVEADAIRSHVATRLPAVMVPSSVGILDRFPLTPNGKVDRQVLPDVAATATPSTGPPVGDGFEPMVAGTWERLLGRTVGRDDNFFDLGGHSLLAVKVFRELSSVTGLQLALTDVFRFPTVRTFSAHLMTLDDPSAQQPAEAISSQDRPTGSARGALRRRARRRPGPGGDLGGG